MNKTVEVIYGDLLEQDVEVIVNPWNRNFIPWWLLLPQGVSGAIKKRAGYQPFQEIAKKGMLKLGEAVLTSAGKLPYKGIIHVAGLNCFWVSTERSIQQSVISAIELANQHGFSSVALPLIGAGTGGKNQEKVKQLILDSLSGIETDAKLVLVIYQKTG